ncbi:MAG: divalent-cation tolerance protein CutA [Candidatus Thorarchaeota archaeon]|nr:MAG: divalent-cation tolerance protein CutA [Candidatus Thorarchaeota archaeon]
MATSVLLPLMTEYIFALTTCPTKEADVLARKLVEARACACVNIVERVRSIYRWKDRLEDEQESILLIKSEKRNRKKLWKIIENNHSYDVPEFIVMSVADGSPDYLRWISGSISTE